MKENIQQWEGPLQYLARIGNLNPENDHLEVKNETRAYSFAIPTKDDVEFALSAAESSLTKVELSWLAVNNSTSPKIKELARNIINTYDRLLEELRTITTDKNISFPTEPGIMNKELIQTLEQKQGDHFDKTYIDTIVNDNKYGIYEFQKVNNNNSDDLKVWVGNSIPPLQYCRIIAETIEKEMLFESTPNLY